MMQDLAVKASGVFVLRYRAVNMLWGLGEQSRRPVVAECWGAPFEVYPANLFPGLKASTELTKVSLTAGSLCVGELTWVVRRRCRGWACR